MIRYTPVRDRSLTRWLGLLLVGVISTCLNAQTPAQTKSNPEDTGKTKAIEPYLGVFRNETMQYEGHVVNGKLLGQITLGDQIARFTSITKGESVKLVVRVNNVESQYTAVVDGDTLTLQAGLQAFKLKRMKAEQIVGNLKITPTPLAKSSDVVDTLTIVNADNTRVAFVKNTGRCRVYLNAKPGKQYFHTEQLRFSPDGNRLAYLAIEGSQWFVVNDGKAGNAFDSIKPWYTRFSGNSKRLGYIGTRKGRWHLVIDGKESEGLDECAGIVFSSDGKRLAYGIKRDGQWRNVIDGKEGPAGTSVGPVVFSPDGKRYVYGLVRGTKEVVYINAEKEIPCDGIEGLMFSPDSKRLAYIIAKGSRMVIVVDGNPSQPFDVIKHATFSRDSQRIAFCGIRDGKQQVIVDGVASAPFDEVGPPVFSPDSRSVAFAALTEKMVHVIRDGTKGKPYEMAHSLSFSPNSKRLAFAAKQGARWLVNADGETGKSFDAVHDSGPVFSPDSEHVLFAATRFGKRYLIANEVENALDSSLIKGSSLVFDDALRFHTITRRGDAFLRIDVQFVR